MVFLPSQKSSCLEPCGPRQCWTWPHCLLWMSLVPFSKVSWALGGNWSERERRDPRPERGDRKSHVEFWGLLHCSVSPLVEKEENVEWEPVGRPEELVPSSAGIYFLSFSFIFWPDYFTFQSLEIKPRFLYQNTESIHVIFSWALSWTAGNFPFWYCYWSERVSFVPAPVGPSNGPWDVSPPSERIQVDLKSGMNLKIVGRE